jgi:hypothetical protein
MTNKKLLFNPGKGSNPESFREEPPRAEAKSKARKTRAALPQAGRLIAFKH